MNNLNLERQTKLKNTCGRRQFWDQSLSIFDKNDQVFFGIFLNIVKKQIVMEFFSGIFWARLGFFRLTALSQVGPLWLQPKQTDTNSGEVFLGPKEKLAALPISF